MDPMTVSQLRTPALAGAVADARESIGAGARVPVGSVATTELAEAISELAALESQVVSLRMALSAEADARGVAHETADTGTDAWLARLTGDPREVLAGGLWIARELQEKYAATREAFAAGLLRTSQVRVIVRAADRAPCDVSPEQLRSAEESLVAMATGAGTRTGRPMDAKRLRQAARRMFESISPELADRHENELLRREEERAEHDTWLMLHDNGDGTYSGRFTIPELHGHLFTAALERLTSPRRLTRDRAGQLVVDETAVHTTLAESRGAAFCELLEHLPTDGHTGNAATLLITLDLESLLDGIGAARLDTGVRISAGAARRLACDAGLVPAVLGGRSEPLDLGRERRLHSIHQRRALALTHDTCAVAGCERPFAWCEIHHHRLAWSRRGRTDLDNALPLCGHHHRRAHDAQWDLRQHTSGEFRFHRRR
jgi:hypothetical protein